MRGFFKLNNKYFKRLHMLVDISKLITVSKFARKINKTSQGVYYLIKQKQLDYEKIDGVWFVVLNFKSESWIKHAKT